MSGGLETSGKFGSGHIALHPDDEEKRERSFRKRGADRLGHVVSAHSATT
jgi:hypothetical protein